MDLHRRRHPPGDALRPPLWMRASSPRGEHQRHRTLARQRSVGVVQSAVQWLLAPRAVQYDAAPPSRLSSSTPAVYSHFYKDKLRKTGVQRDGFRRISDAGEPI
jgi:hypothetical protein